ncbi:glutathione S-transferase family protein [Sphingomonas floccifaciens]|uniref:Glutathione S-transferase family protein n=1 Tax=Sphingomonas floccifaciens TaxID=1844115 RepID=A0ABW4N9U1_9SPHN
MAYRLITANRNYSSWSLRPWLLMTALGLPFDDRIETFVTLNNYDAFRAFSPTGQVPVLIDGDRTVWDSLGIVMYLADRHDGVWPTDPDARAWAMCAVAEMHGGFSALRNERTMTVGQRVAPHGVSPALTKDVARLTELWAEGLERFGGPWLAGREFTAVDAFYAPVAFRVRTYGIDVGRAGGRWVEAMLAHPAMQAWEQAALAETFREEGHEAEVAATGIVTADHRAAPV